MRVITRRRFISAALAACAVGVIAPRAREHDEAGGIPYGAARRQRLDLYAPAADAGSKRPIVVYFYGGAWQSGHRSDSHGVAQALAAHGVVTVAADYRLYPDTVFPSFLDDPATAVRWAHDHAHEFGGDPQRLFVMGHSSGAHMASMLATDPRYLAAHGLSNRSLAGMIGLAGPYAVIPTTDPHMDEIFPAALRSQALPIAFVDGNEPPMFLAAGTDDKDVDPRNSDRFADVLRAHHDKVELKKYPGLGHVTIVESFSAKPGKPSPVLADVVAFIDAH
ncbi:MULTISPECIES: alpha/beta hydrolase [unclassified Caballeronia]|uniref:alpha/beta hydrolase n=1 Tax=unclassified Caballeronia TaxID=2646786 RepID=UPI002861C2DB|nr:MULTISPECIES: alpha/beta hydrolase [unclassified Caballeronia]MDR5816358.1 alpha/beta hydrolase [Caballeronia sp. LZ033]MDR5823025.1 alpha/beta hydrolase [Caballeronia sp. LZ043]MDR5881156.1 alpha/beta hydrolase [Caballeronia sp. LZ032]